MHRAHGQAAERVDAYLPVAESYSDGNVFCLADAVHRVLPAFQRLGSNTCIQDAFNLAWKINHVMSSRAGPELLETYNVER